MTIVNRPAAARSDFSSRAAASVADGASTMARAPPAACHEPHPPRSHDRASPGTNEVSTFKRALVPGGSDLGPGLFPLPTCWYQIGVPRGLSGPRGDTACRLPV